MSTGDVELETVSIPARDGYGLAGTLYRPADPRGVVVLHGATAVPHRFYRRFATFLAEAGYVTLAYDYRGIGASRPARLGGFQATMRDWALLDMSGATSWAFQELGSERLFLVGHSFGGQAAGMIDDRQRIAGMVTFSSQSGYWRLQGGEQKIMVALHVHVLLPLLARLLGYVPMSRLAAGEDLPAGVAAEWARWCRHPKYLLGDPTLPLDRYEEFTAPVLAYSFVDDKWGTAESVDAMMTAYPDVERRHVHPADLGVTSIGHLGAFRPEARPLWDELIAWLDER